MDSDTVDELILVGRDRRRLNVRVLSSNNSTVGAIETMNGNTLIAFTLPTGTNKVIGAVEDLLRKKSYYFVYNTASNHTILEFDEQANTISKVFQDSVNILGGLTNILRFKPNFLITGIAIIELDENNHLLYWTDDYVDPTDAFVYNEPKKINIEKGKFFMAANFTDGYPTPFDPENLFRIKQPHNFPPTGVYGDDPLVSINFLEQKLFRFQVQYVYDDKEQTALSPFSKSIYPKNICGDDTDASRNNFIALTIDTGIEIVKRILVYAKEVNSGDAVLVADLDKAELQIASNSTYVYNFYNDGNYLPLEVNQAIKLYDRVPKREQALASIDGIRLTDGNITEEFDLVPADLKLNLSVQKDYAQQTYNITGKIYIPNLFLSRGGDGGTCLNTSPDPQGYNINQPIWTTNGETAVWGGLGGELCDGYVENIEDYNQKLPDGGFHVYLAGTSHDAISVQQANGLTLSNSWPLANVYEMNDNTQRNNVRAKVKDLSRPVYSVFTIQDVPPGKYIMRISPDSDQTHSTYAYGIGGYLGSPYECVLELQANGNVLIDGVQYEYDFSVNSVSIPDSYVLDLTGAKTGTLVGFVIVPGGLIRTSVVDGYLKDAEGYPMELSRVNFVRGSVFGDDFDLAIAQLAMEDQFRNGPGTTFINEKFNDMNYLTAVCDHNGFFFSLTPAGLQAADSNASYLCNVIHFKVKSIYTGNILQIYSGQLESNCRDANGAQPSPNVIQTTIDNDLRTRLIATVFYKGEPIQGVIAISTRGGFDISNSSGDVNIVIYPDTDVATRADDVLFYFNGDCIASFQSGTNQEDYSLTIGASAPPTNYNFNNPYPLQDSIVEEILGQSPVVSLKRGGVYLCGLIYYDHGDRSGLTNVNDSRFDQIDPLTGKYGTKLFVPFYTEPNINDLAVLEFTMEVDTIEVLNSGAGYDVPGTATIVISGGGATTDATADVVVGDGEVVQLAIINYGLGYTIGVYLGCPLTGGSGAGATADVIIIDGGIATSAITLAGSGYPTNGVFLGCPLIGGSGSGATADITIAGGIVTIATIVNYGYGYTVLDVLNPDVQTTGTPSTDAEITVNTISPSVSSLVLVSGGSGYLITDILSPDSATVGVPAFAATIGVDSDYGLVIDIINITPGDGYTSMPQYVITDNNGVGATVEITMKVEAITIVSGGLGYSYIPLISFVGGNPLIEAQADAEVINGVVTSVDSTNPGQQYKSFPTLNIQGKIWGGSWPIVDWEIYNLAPSWATHYQWARQKNSETDLYIDFVADTVTYVNDSGDPSPPFTQIQIKVSNIYIQFKAMFKDSVLVYDFVKSQRIRYVKSANDEGVFYDQYWDFKVKSFDTGTGIISVEYDGVVIPELKGSPNVPSPFGGFSFEIYLPKLIIPTDQQITFEIGECYDVLYDSVNDLHYHEGQTVDQKLWLFSDNQALNSTYDSINYTLGFIGAIAHGLVTGDKIKVTQDAGATWDAYDTYFIVTGAPTIYTITVNGFFLGNTPAEGGLISRAAQGQFDGGDTFYRFRRMPYNTGVVDVKTRLIQDSNFSDFYASKAWDLGRPNKIDDQIAEVTRPTTVYYTDKLIPETNINGLSSISDTSLETYDQKHGAIMKMYSENEGLRIYQELKIGLVPVERIIYNDLHLNNTVGASTVVIPPQVIYDQGEFGIGQHPESFCVYANSKYGIDVRRGTFWRQSQDGITPIGDTGNMHNYFNDKCRNVLAHGSKVNIYACYDIRFNECVVAFEAFTNGIVVHPAETLAWNEKANAWSTFYSFAPEFMCSNGVDLVSFNAGRLYTHNTNPLQANFYGTQYKPEVWCVVNDQPSIRKVLLAISEETNSAWEVYEILTPNGQKSSLLTADFQEIENNQYADLWRDELTPNIVVSPAILPNALFEGDPMRDRTFLCKFRYVGTDYNKLFAVNMHWIGSERNTR